MTRPAGPTRQIIIDAAYVLLRRKGFARVSIDEIAAAADVTKRTLYHHFDSKDALVTAVFQSQSALALAAFQTFGRQLSGPPVALLDELFAELAGWSSKRRWPGSGFTRLVHELADLPGHPAREIARAHKAALEAHLAELLAGAGLEDAAKRSREIFVLLEGAMALILIHGDTAYAAAAAEAARRLVCSSAAVRLPAGVAGEELEAGSLAPAT